jgi:DNA-binding NarL/FixJ family response regulator
MSAPSQKAKAHKRERTNSQDSLYMQPDVALLNQKQWRYVQRRYHISPRELQVAKLACRGLVNADIADRLGIKPATVKVHLKSLFGKTRVRSKITMLLRFVEDGDGLFGESARLAARARL